MKRIIYVFLVVGLSLCCSVECYGAVRLRVGMVGLRQDVSLVARSMRSVVVDTSSIDAVVAAARGGRIPVLLEYDRKITAQDRQRLRTMNVSVARYIPDNSLLVMLSAGHVDKLKFLAGLVWVGGYLSDYKVDPSLDNNGVRTAADNHEEQSPLEVVISTLCPRYVHEVERYVVDSGGWVVESGKGPRWGTVRAVVAQSAIATIASLSGVEWIEPYRESYLMNNVAAQAPRMNVVSVWANHGLTGNGQVLAVADSGLDTGSLETIHPDFSNRVRSAYGWVGAGMWADHNGHGTHVAGSVLGSGAAYSNGYYRGIAHEAELVMQSIGDTNGSSSVYVPQPLNNLFVQARTNGARIHSDSWGASAGGRYTSNSRQVDEFMWDYDDMLIVFSAGNSGVDANGDGVVDLGSIGAPGSAKNCLTVGAAESLRPVGSGGYSELKWGDGWPVSYPTEPIVADLISTPWDGTNQGMAAFSSRGPCQDGRVKPDVIAPGTDIISCRSHMPDAGSLWGTGSGLLSGSVSNDYCFSGGTSMSTPLVAGSVGIARQYLAERAAITNPSAALMKGLLVNGARSIGSGQYGTNEYREIPTGARPNNVEGWGQVDLANSLFPAEGLTNLFWDRGSLVTEQTNRFAVVVTGSNAMHVTLAWSDYPAALSSAQQLVNDLDMCLVQPSGTRLYPNGATGFDHTNNLLGVDVELAELGTNYIELTGFNVAEGPQTYGLIVKCLGYAAAEHGVRSVSVRNGRFFAGEDATIDAVVTTNDSGIATVVVAYRVNAMGWQYENMVFSADNGLNKLYSIGLPGMEAGDSIEYYVYAMAFDMALSISETNSTLVEGKTVYVSKNGSSSWPYHTWDMAFTSIVDALDYVDSGFDVLVTNGIYGSETIIVDEDVKLLGVAGAEETFVDGQNSRMCMIVDADADVSGFTLQNGYALRGACLGMNGGVVSNCIVRSGQAVQYGGGIELVSGLMDKCVISNNNAGLYGGGVLIRGGVIQNSLIIDNTSVSDAGGLEHWGGVISNCTVVFNHSGNCGGGIDVGDPASEVYNCIVVSNTAVAGGPNWYEWFDIDFMYCCSHPSPEGTGNFDMDPLFADLGARDFHLQSTRGRFVSAGTWTNDIVTSPCIDMGDPASGYASESLPNGSRVNMGMYANTPEASRGANDRYNVLIVSPIDKVHPEAGRHEFFRGQGVACSVTSAIVAAVSTQFVASGWTLDGVMSTGGTNSGTNAVVTFMLTNSAILRWNWDTNYLLTTYDASHGRVSGATNGWHKNGAMVRIRGVEDSYYAFDGWTGTLTSASNPLEFQMTRAYELWSRFSEAYTSNGVPELWLAQYGWTNNFEAAANGDQDGDGAVTWHEYVAGTIPTNGESVLELNVSKEEDGPTVLNWSSSSNRLYSLYWSTNLAMGVTNYMFGIYTVFPMQLSFDDTIHSNEAGLYYRIKVRKD